ncbi:MAG: HAD-IA family hydrolase [Thermaerobacter sp.]|nr:HAD-IA family hydrolase [Thermaerobacter sp.]
MPGSVEGLIFDVDGTLADTETAGHLPAFNAAFSAAGLAMQWDWETYRQLYRFPSGVDRIRQGLLEWSGIPPSDEVVTALHLAKTHAYQERLNAGLIVLRPGIARIIGEAHAHGLKLAIATTSRSQSARILVASQLGPEALTWFHPILGFEDGLTLKPAPDQYLKALEVFGLPADQVVAFEDSTAGVAAARAAGLPTLVTVNELTRSHDFSGAFAVLENLGEPEQPAAVWDQRGPSAQTAVVDLAWLNSRLATLSSLSSQHPVR